MKLIAGLLAGTLRGAVPVSAGGKLAARTSVGIAIRSTIAAQSILSSSIVAQSSERVVAPSGSIFSSSTAYNIDSGFCGGKSLNYGAQFEPVDCKKDAAAVAPIPAPIPAPPVQQARRKSARCRRVRSLSF